MIGALVAIISLNLTSLLVSDYGVVGKSFPISHATATTPIRVTSTNHGVPLGRVVHGVVSGVTGTVEANGLWVLTPTDANTFSLSTYTAQGIVVESVGTNAYISGGQIQCAFPDYQILLGRRNKALTSAVASPRVVFIPTAGRAWDFESYGGQGPAPLKLRGSAEQQSQKLEPQLGTEFSTFEVYVTGSAPDYGASGPSPDYGDFDATQAIVHALFSVLFDASGPPRAKVLRETWTSQTPQSGSMSQRGQQWMGVIELQQPVYRVPLQYVPVGTYIEMTVQPVNPASEDILTFPVGP
jgi:hypothetical protein